MIVKAALLMDKKMRNKSVRGPPPVGAKYDPSRSRWAQRTEKGLDPMLTIHDRETRTKANDALRHCREVFDSQ